MTDMPVLGTGLDRLDRLQLGNLVLQFLGHQFIDLGDPGTWKLRDENGLADGNDRVFLLGQGAVGVPAPNQDE